MLVHPRRAPEGVEDDLVGPRQGGPEGDLPAMPVEREVAEVQRVGELHPQAARVGDDSPPVHEEPGGVERLPAAQVLRLERGDPQPVLEHGALDGAVAPGGIGQPRVAPAREHVDVRVQGLVDVAQGGHVLEEDPQGDHGGPCGRVGTSEGEDSGIGTSRAGPGPDFPLEIGHHVGRRLLRERRRSPAPEQRADARHQHEDAPAPPCRRHRSPALAARRDSTIVASHGRPFTRSSG